MSSPPTPHRMPILQKVVFTLLGLTLIVSVSARIHFQSSSTSSSAVPAGARSFAAEMAEKEPEAIAWWHSVLPVVTEASLFGLIGFALGYTTRKVFKLALVGLALAFVVLQVLVARGTIAVDWSGLTGSVQGWILNLHPDVPIVEFLKTRIPTAIAFVACWFVGFRRG